MRKPPQPHCGTCTCHYHFEMVNPWINAPDLVAFALGHRGSIWDEEEFFMFLFIICERYGRGGRCYHVPGKFGIHLFNYLQWIYGITNDLLEEPEPKELSIKQMRDALGRLHNKGFIKLTMKSNRSIIMEAEILV